ncbi:glycosyltransferase family 4 protein [Winogradskyella undariae]|uniref:glycosyltransferase family 4 protein n=1 Tax=Winogradskyella undariae TaxID=1285465 RepID=UPI0015CB2DAA|nr:glycosyltransferase family 4 protein [Winogradskyella undariae]
MTIGLVLPALPTYSETFFVNKIKGLQSHGVEVVLFVNGGPSKSRFLGCRVVHAPKFNGFIFYVLFHALIALINTFVFNPVVSLRFYLLNKADGISFKQNVKQVLSNQFILNCTLDWLHFGFGTMVLGKENIAQSINAKMAVSFRGFDIGIYPLKHPGCYQKLFHKVNKIHVISNDLKRLVYNNSPINKFDIITINPAIDISFFLSTLESKSTLGSVKLLSIGRLHWKKGFEDTLEALLILKKQGISFSYTIVGDGEEHEALLFAIHQLGLEDEVFLKGKLSHEAVKSHLKESDIYLQYSKQEGFCNAVLEAQAMGLLCVVSDAEGLSENVLDGYSGWVVPKRQPNLLAKKLEEVIHLKETEQLQIRKQAQKRVNDIFNLDVQIDKFLKFYEIRA